MVEDPPVLCHLQTVMPSQRIHDLLANLDIYADQWQCAMHTGVPPEVMLPERKRLLVHSGTFTNHDVCVNS